MLILEGVSAFHGNLRAVCNVSLDIAAGEFVGVFGANGAGKTTLLRTICGLMRPGAGRIMLDGVEISACSPAERVARGLVYCPEDRKLFARMSVLENLELGAFTRPATQSDRLAQVFELFPALRERRHQLAGSLSGGQQQMLAIARTLMSSPRLVLLDEPSTGLAPLVAEQLMEVISSLNRGGMTILLVEQNMHLALDVVQRGCVIENGAMVLTDTAERLRSNDNVRRSYLGG
jgi:branched-chain amino acid transport system ATP-binding protein